MLRISLTTWLLIGALIALCFEAYARQANEDMLMDIQHSQFADQFQTLLAGEQEIAIRVSESNTPITRGVAVLISEAGRGPFNENGIAQLSSALNNVGWVTMIMQAPSVGFDSKSDELNKPEQESTQQPDQAAGNNDPNVAQQADETVHPKQGLVSINETAFAAHEQELITRMQAVVQRTQDYPGFFLVIARGTSAAWLTKIYAEKKLDLPDAMVAVSPFWPERQFNKQLPEWVSQTEMPYLDMYSPWDPEWALSTTAQRKIQAQKALKLLYRQKELIGQKLDEQQYDLLAKEIYGWLTFMGW